MVAQNGGDDGAGAFLVAWVIFLFLWSIPLIIAEYIMGRKSRKGTVGAFVSLVGGKFAWMGGFVGLVTAIIACYYSVVVGWCIYYFTQMLFGSLPQTTDAAWSLWSNYQFGATIYCFAYIRFQATIVIFDGVREPTHAHETNINVMK